MLITNGKDRELKHWHKKGEEQHTTEPIDIKDEDDQKKVDEPAFVEPDVTTKPIFKTILKISAESEVDIPPPFPKVIASINDDIQPEYITEKMILTKCL
ncbi:hypothetical protein L2E82_35843 [Cichorium intybus]|uniref:Uncharacterized protein n=1 Tax=Cichorium intybus TaxID=13427 RepID=A0ACB9BPW8_CICIN|nr:hypothetical protein L2E82_35843 [Cichorium intybus]